MDELPWRGHLRRRPAIAVEGVVLLLLWLLFASLIHWRSWGGEILFHPMPDAIEYVYVANALAHGYSPLLPIADELHPCNRLSSPMAKLLAGVQCSCSAG